MYGRGSACDNVATEIALISTGIIVLKVVYGLDGRPRVPSSEVEVACALPRMEEYLERLKRIEEDERKGKWGRKPIRMENLTGKEMDDYLGFTQEALLGEGDRDDDSDDDILNRFFPLDTPKRELHVRTAAAAPQWHPVMANLSEELRPGERYRVYRASDVGGNVHETYDTVLGRAARWVNVSADRLAVIVEAYERRLKNRSLGVTA